MSSSELPAVQREVQRLLGRCLLRIQQYEQLIKTVLADHKLAGPAASLEEIKSARVASFSKQTLGQNANELLSSFLVKSDAKREADDRFEECDSIGFSFHTTLTMSHVDYTRTEKALKALVDLRNELVHHLVDRFDLWSEQGCSDAAAHLKHSYTLIDGHLEQLQHWTKPMRSTCSLTAAFMQTPEFIDFFENGINLDGSVDWAASGIVALLREVLAQISVDGWGRLNDAINIIRRDHPDQPPSKYACKTWRQVVRTSELLELQNRRSEDGSREAWYREKPSSAPGCIGRPTSTASSR